jgi:2-keto-4-pentenoate hydratase
LAGVNDIADLGIADAFRVARQTGKALAGFPGLKPTSLVESYGVQDEAIDLWPDDVAGWKVGRILGELADVLGADRLIGPIFEQSVQNYQIGSVANFMAIEGGFCAVEAEYVFKLGKDAPKNGQPLDDEQALDLVATLHIGIEIAGSPLATINDLGPCVVISDFGNNAGLIIGPPVNNWRARIADLNASTTIDGVEIGRGDVSAFPGGIAQALSFAVNLAAKRGRPLKRGMLISSGAVSGVHSIHAGQSAVAYFGDDGEIACLCGAWG